MTYEELIEGNKKLVEELNKIVLEEIKPLNPDQLNWKPSAKKWSVIECLDHLNMAGRHYIKEISKSFDNTNKTNNDLEKKFKSGTIGGKAAKIMKPTQTGTIKNKISTFPSLMPDYSNINTDIVIDETVDQLSDFNHLLEKSKGFDLNAIKIKSLLGPILNFKLGDSFNFVLNHSYRHLIQAKNVIANSRFPK